MVDPGAVMGQGILVLKEEVALQCKCFFSTTQTVDGVPSSL